MEVKLDQELSKEVKTHEELTREGIKVSASYQGAFATVGLSVEVKLIELLEKMAADSSNKIDDTLVALVKAAL